MAPRLRAGEESRAYRVRAPAWVHERLRSMSPAQVGAVLARVLRHGDG